MSGTDAEPGHRATKINAAAVVIVGPGCTRRDLPANAGARTWVVDIAPGAEWPPLQLVV